MTLPGGRFSTSLRPFRVRSVIGGSASAPKTPLPLRSPKTPLPLQGSSCSLAWLCPSARNCEAKSVVRGAMRWVVASPSSRPTVLRAVMQRGPTNYAIIAFCWPTGVFSRNRWIFPIAILAPFPYQSVHVPESPRIRNLCIHRLHGVSRIAGKPSVVPKSPFVVAPVKCSLGTSPTGVFPLGLCWQ